MSQFVTNFGKVAVLMGGQSAEREISLMSGLGQRIQQRGGAVGAVIGHHDDLGEPDQALPNHPFQQERPLVSHRADNRGAQSRPFP